MWKNSQPTSQEAKTWGLNQALLWFMNSGFTCVAIELDNKLVVDDILSEICHKSEFGVILNVCRKFFIKL